MSTLSKALLSYQQLIFDSVRNGGQSEFTSIIRSSRPIQFLHEAVKASFIDIGINPSNLAPTVNQSSPELKLSGLLKQKKQDICIKPQNIQPVREVLEGGLLDGELDIYGKAYTESIIAINVRSQISSLDKNFDTLYERTIAEASNLHDRCPKMCLGEVYMIAVPEINQQRFSNYEISFLTFRNKVTKYIKSFNAINNRREISDYSFKYERVCLLIVDFNQNPIRVYNSDSELINAGLLTRADNISISDLTWDTFFPSIMEIYNSRFPFIHP